jgi:hypothetical protein
MGLQENKSIVQGFYDQWNSGAIDFERLIHPNITNHQPDRKPEIGLDRFRQAIEGVMGAVITGGAARMEELFSEALPFSRASGSPSSMSTSAA